MTHKDIVEYSIAAIYVGCFAYASWQACKYIKLYKKASKEADYYRGEYNRVDLLYSSTPGRGASDLRDFIFINNRQGSVVSVNIHLNSTGMRQVTTTIVCSDGTFESETK